MTRIQYEVDRSKRLSSGPRNSLFGKTMVTDGLSISHSVLDCCGLSGIKGFPSDDIWGSRGTELRKRQDKNFRDCIKYYIQESAKSNRAMIMATTAPYQSKAKRALVKMGFVATECTRPYGASRRDSQSKRNTILVLDLGSVVKVIGE